LEIDGGRAVAFRSHGGAWACIVFYLEISKEKRKTTLACTWRFGGAMKCNFLQQMIVIVIIIGF
jgi:hypothetical protein